MKIKYRSFTEMTVCERLDYEILNDYLYEKLTPMESAVLFWIEWGFSNQEIIDHFEFSKQRLSQIKKNIGKKLLEIYKLLEEE